MTTHDRDKIIAATKDLGIYFGGDGNPPEWIEQLYAIAFAAGAASRDAEIAELVAALEFIRPVLILYGDYEDVAAFDKALAKVRKEK